MFGSLYLWLAVTIFGAAGAITRKLNQLGSMHLVDGQNPISFCNVLFVGNLCALVTLLCLYGRRTCLQELRALSRWEWFWLLVVACGSGALVPALTFQALALTDVNTVVLVGRLQSPLLLVFSWLWRKERFHFWEVLGAGLSTLGVLIIIWLHSSGATTPTMELGEGLSALAAAILALSLLLGKAKLKRISLGTFNIFRTAIGTFVFYWIALVVYGQNHFAEAFSPFLWQWMVLYGAVIVVLGQSFWGRGLRTASTAEVTRVSAFTPLAGMLAAFLVLGEVPDAAQWIGGGVILLGILLGGRGLRQRMRSASQASSLATVGMMGIGS